MGPTLPTGHATCSAQAPAAPAPGMRPGHPALAGAPAPCHSHGDCRRPGSLWIGNVPSSQGPVSWSGLGPFLKINFPLLRNQLATSRSTENQFSR